MFACISVPSHSRSGFIYERLKCEIIRLPALSRATPSAGPVWCVQCTSDRWPTQRTLNILWARSIWRVLFSQSSCARNGFPPRQDIVQVALGSTRVGLRIARTPRNPKPELRKATKVRNEDKETIVSGCPGTMERSRSESMVFTLSLS